MMRLEKQGSGANPRFYAIGRDSESQSEIGDGLPVQKAPVNLKGERFESHALS
jgi:hypothetical protein